ncbi:MAG: hypothetical protein LQ337_005416 [Flavoplaca oasis]|nr:MAG: hypothetical protein LQ337_005416 [Flavoplaca oasis]
MHNPLIHLTALCYLLLSNIIFTTSYPLQPEIASHMEHTAKTMPVTAPPPAAHRVSPPSPPSYLPTNPENHPSYPEPPYPIQTTELAERGFGDWAKKKWNRFKDWLREPMKRSLQTPLEERTSGNLEKLNQDLADLFEATTSFDTATSSSNASQQAKAKLVERGFREWLEKGFGKFYGWLGKLGAN